MKIAFDAKRIFTNYTGLGNYGRTLLSALMHNYPEHDYVAYTPGIRDDLMQQVEGAYHIKLPDTRWQKAWPSLWRSYGIANDILRDRTDIFHGLSNEIPFGLAQRGIPTIVTIHDVIFRKHPEQYPALDRMVYHIKTAYAVKHANCIIAVSEETKQDLLKWYGVPENKIEVIHPIVTSVTFSPDKTNDSLTPYFIYVSAFESRKNHKQLIDAYGLIAGKVDEELWLIGHGGRKKKEVSAYIAAKGLENKIRILENVSNEKLPELYRNATALVYPSLFEGFGIPVAEAALCKTAVIVTENSAMQEAGGPEALTVNPYQTQDIADKMYAIASNHDLRKRIANAVYQHALRFNPHDTAKKLMSLYNRFSR